MSNLIQSLTHAVCCNWNNPGCLRYSPKAGKYDTDPIGDPSISSGGYDGDQPES